MVRPFVVDGIVNGAAGMVRQMAMLAGLHDKYVVNGAVTHGRPGPKHRAPPCASPRRPVACNVCDTAMIVIAVGLAGAIIVALSRVTSRQQADNRTSTSLTAQRAVQRRSPIARSSTSARDHRTESAGRMECHRVVLGTGYQPVVHRA